MSDKVAIVTNATSDIGWAISKQLMAKKVRVIGTGDDEAALGDASQHYELFDGQVVDPIAEDAVENFVKQATDKYGEIDYSFQIAVPYQAGLIIDEQLTDWNFMIDLALNGVFYSSRTLVDK
ncbi:SDR family NAD(P)-dependent oxidoreductase [Lentilactobacillus rapi]|uniref:SDR family NAD(P)-dependent oxidoreductase n=1 Tax=Lentilactobacillus rapi TaxID=481723 RepID=UPI0006CF4AD0|nr:SDR family NAD(P)-dependent oxidoreductase [Lentilactobacillus rapi]